MIDKVGELFKKYSLKEKIISMINVLFQKEKEKGQKKIMKH